MLAALTEQANQYFFCERCLCVVDNDMQISLLSVLLFTFLQQSESAAKEKQWQDVVSAAEDKLAALQDAEKKSVAAQ